MQPTSKNLLALGLAGSLALAACGGGDGDASPAQSGEPRAVPTEGGGEAPDTRGGRSASVDAPAVDDPAAVLFADLTGALQDHVYLAGITFEAALDAGGDLNDPEVSAATEALDENSQAIAARVASFAGDDQEEPFLELWRDHIGFFTDYTLATAQGDDTAAATAVDGLESYKEASGAFFEEATDGQLAADAVVDVLDGHTTTLLDAIDALIAEDPRAVGVLQEAARHMQDAAQAIAGAVAMSQPEEFSGEVTAAASENHATIAALLREHVFLNGIAVEQAAETGEGMDGLAIAAATPAIEANAQDLADALGVAADSRWEAAFLELWIDHVRSLVEYGVGTATGDEALAESARTRLEGFRVGMAALLDDITGDPADADLLATQLEDINSSMVEVIDAIAAGDEAAITRLAETAQETSAAAEAIARAVTDAS